MVFMILNAYFINIDLSPFLKENSDRSDTKLFYKVKHGEYNKNLF